MSDLLYSVNTVLPLLLIAVLGGVLRRSGLFKPGFISGASQFIYYISFPLATFKCLAACDLRQGVSLLPFLLIIAYNVVFCSLSLLLVPRLIREKPRAASICQSLVRQARLAQSIPLLTIMYGENSIGLSMLLMPIAVIMENLSAITIFLTLTPQAGKSSKLAPFRSFFTNPIIVAAMAGLAVSILRIPIPAPLTQAVSSISATASPLALLLMGAQFDASHFRKDMRLTLPATLLHLLVFPAVSVTAAALLGLRGLALATILVYTGSANAASSVVLAENMGGDSDLANQCLCSTTVVSGFTLMLGIFVLKSLQLI